MRTVWGVDPQHAAQRDGVLMGSVAGAHRLAPGGAIHCTHGLYDCKTCEWVSGHSLESILDRPANIQRYLKPPPPLTPAPGAGIPLDSLERPEPEETWRSWAIEAWQWAYPWLKPRPAVMVVDIPQRPPAPAMRPPPPAPQRPASAMRILGDSSAWHCDRCEHVGAFVHDCADPPGTHSGGPA